MMNNRGNAVVWVIIVILVIAGILLLVFSGDGENGDETATTTNESTEQTTTESAAQVEAALAGGDAVRCQYESDGDVSTISYIKDGEIRTVTENETAAGNMIYTDGQIYVWEAGATEGVILSEEEASQESNRTPMLVRPSDVEEAAVAGDVSCQQDEVDDTFFDLPADVEFVAFSETDGEMPVR